MTLGGAHESTSKWKQESNWKRQCSTGESLEPEEGWHFVEESDRIFAHAFQKLAGGFAAQLQDSVEQADALQGLLLDRVAASYLRKQPA